MRKETENVLIFSWTIVGMLAVVIMVVSLGQRVNASDWSVAATVASHHPFESTYECDGIETDYNEDNPGIVVRYKYLMVGRFENSFSGCRGHDYSTLLGIEDHLGDTGPIRWSVSAGIADGYPEEETTFDEYRAWASVNARLGIFKVYYGYRVLAFAIEVDF